MSNNINNVPPIKKNITSQKKPEEESKQKKKSKSQIKYIKNPDIITQAKPLYLNNLILPLNPHISSLTPTNICNKLNEKDEPLLPPKEKEFENKKTLILDLDETLVHSSFTPFEKNDIILEVDFEGIMYNIYVLVRPFAKEFIINVSKYFEVVIFTASIPKYASPLLDILDKQKNIKHRLYREQCTFINGLYIKDLKRLNRPLKDLIIVDNSPLAYAFNEENGLPIKTWYDDYSDNELQKILPLIIFLSNVNDVRTHIINFVDDNEIKYTEANDLIEKYDNGNNNVNNKQKDEQKNKENKDIINNINNENSLFNDYKIITSNIKKNVNTKFCFNNIINNKQNNGKLNLSSQRVLNKSDNEKNNINLIPIKNINSVKQRNSSTNNNNDDKNDFDNDKKQILNIGILLRKQSGKKKNLFRLNQKAIEPLFNLKVNKINNENNKGTQKNSFYNSHVNLQNLVLPFSNTTKNLLFPKSIFNNNFMTNNKINMAPINMTKNGIVDNNQKNKYTNLLEKIDKKGKNNFTYRNEDNMKISFSNSNKKELIFLGNNKNINKYKYLQISKSNSINNILKFNNLSNNVNINTKFAKTPNKHLINIFGKENNSNFGFSKKLEKTNMLYNLIKGLGTPKNRETKNVAYSANPRSIRNRSKNVKLN
jgi:RNA polymerase II subunit A small phosphatase-like protein